MKMKQMQQPSSGNFKEFVDEHSPEEAMEVEREWRKHAREKKDQCYTRIMLAAVVAMAVLFFLLISFLSEGEKVHGEVDYHDEGYTYFKSSMPHLKFLMRSSVSTPETKLLKALGLLYPELLAYLEANLKESHRVLLVPNEATAVPLLAVTAAYYLKTSRSGHLRILTDSPDYRELTDRNLQEMRKQHVSDRFPVSFSPRTAQNCSQFDLVIIENNPYHMEIPNCTATVVLIRKEGAGNSVVDSYFPAHIAREIVKGRSTVELRAEGKRSGYAVVPYILSEKSENNYILLESEAAAKTTQMCPERDEAVKGREELRNLVEYIRNRTADCGLYFDIPQNEVIPLLFSTGVGKIYTREGLMVPTDTLIAVSSPKDMPKYKRNLYVTHPTQLGNFDFSMGSEDAVLVWVEGGSVLPEESLKRWQVSTLSPRNNDGCFLPPAGLWGAVAADRARFLVLQPKER